MRFLAGLTVVLVAISIPAHGTVRFVGHAGSDVGGCATASLPCETIQYAIDQSASGDTIRVQEGGRYLENLEISTAIASLTIEGGWTDSFGWQHLDPTATVIDGDEDGHVILVQTGAGSTHLRLENLTIQNGSPSPSPYGGGVAVNTLSGMTAKVTLDRVVLRDNHAGTGGGAAVRAWGGTAELVIQHSMIVGNIAGEGGGLAAVADLEGTAKIRLESSKVLANQAQEWPDSRGYGGAVYATSTREGAVRVEVVNSILAHNPSHHGGVYGRSGDCDGCHMPATTDIIMINATVTDNSTTGIVVRSWDYGQTDLTIWNTVAWGNSYYDIDAMGDHETTEVDVWYSDVQRTTIGFNATYTLHGTNYDTDPLFVDPDRSDYHLTDTSPMIDAGICGLLIPNPIGAPFYVRIAPLLDIDDDVRPASEELWNCDIGADEFTPFERWVSPGGTDTANSCTDSASPCATIQHTLDRAIADGGHYKTVVYLATGTYPEAVSVSDSPAPVTLWGGWSADFSSYENSAFTTIIDANGLGGALDYQVASGTADLRLENLMLADGVASLGGGLSFRCTLSHGLLHLERVALHANHATDSGGGMRIRPVACDLRVRVFDSLVTDNSAVNGGGGIWFRIDDGSSLHASLYASTVAGNDASYGGGVIFQQTGTGKGWLFPNGSLLALNHGVADGPDDLWIEQSGSNFVLVDASHSSIQSVTQYGGLYDPDGTVITANPGFRDPASGDYHLTPYSQVRGLGNCGLGSTLDCDGDARPSSDCDMGADQFDGAWVPPLDLWITNEELSGGMVREACRSITVGPVVTVQPSSVELRAGDYLVFDNGFEIATNAGFIAKLYRHAACL